MSGNFRTNRVASTKTIMNISFYITCIVLGQKNKCFFFFPGKNDECNIELFKFHPQLWQNSFKHLWRFFQPKGLEFGKFFEPEFNVYIFFYLWTRSILRRGVHVKTIQNLPLENSGYRKYDLCMVSMTIWCIIFHKTFKSNYISKILQIWTHLPKKSWMKNFIFYAVKFLKCSQISWKITDKEFSSK